MSDIPNSNGTEGSPFDRCRLVLIVPATVAVQMGGDDARALAVSGDIASVVFTPNALEESAFQDVVEPLIPIFQEAGAAVMVDTATRVAGRCHADGLQLGQDVNELADAIDKFSPGLMVGASNVKTRHNALVIGELQPDYLMFGKADGDIRPEPHPKNLDLGKWWSALVEIPCVVLGGTDIESAITVAETGAEFVALSTAIFAPQGDGKENGQIDFKHAAANIANVNALLDERAPRFENVDE